MNTKSVSPIRSTASKLAAILFLGLLGLPVSPAEAKIGFEVTAGASCSTANQTSCTLSAFNVSKGSGNSRLVFVGVTTEPVEDVTDVQLNSTSGTEIREDDDATDSKATISLWRFLDADLPGSGNFDIVATTSATNNINIVAVFLTGVKQAAPEAQGGGFSYDTAGGNDLTSISRSITTTTDCAWILDVVHTGESSSTTGFNPVSASPNGSGQTERGSDSCANSSCGARSTKEVSPAAAFTMSWALSSGHTNGGLPRAGLSAAAFAPSRCRRPIIVGKVGPGVAPGVVRRWLEGSIAWGPLTAIISGTHAFRD